MAKKNLNISFFKWFLFKKKSIVSRCKQTLWEYFRIWSFSGNNPTEIEIWGRQTIEGAETLPEFESSGNNVTSVPVATGAFEDAGWQLITTQQIDGVNSDFAEFDIPEGPMSRYIRIRFTSTVEGNSCQFIEMAFNGMGAIPSN